MKYIILTGLIFMVITFTISCSRDMDYLQNGLSPAKIDNAHDGDAPTASTATDYSAIYSGIGVVPTKVDSVPDGYMQYTDAEKKYGNVFFIGFFESQVYIRDTDGNGLYQTSISNSDFIVEYKNALFVNMSKINEILPEAQKTADVANKTYSIGEPVEISNFLSDPAIITIKSVSYADNYESVDLKDSEWVCIVKLSIDGLDKNYENIWDYFDHAEGFNGEIYRDVLHVDDTSQIVFKLPKGQKAEYLFVASARSGEKIRKIDIGKTQGDGSYVLSRL